MLVLRGDTALLGVVVAFGVAIVAGVNMDDMSTADNWIVGIPTALVILVAPAMGVVAAVRAAASRNRSGIAALTVWITLLLLALFNFLR